MPTGQQDALEEVLNITTQNLKENYGGKKSNQFIEEVKSLSLSQLHWGELLSIAPTALSLLGPCSIAAATPAADKMILKKPEGGFAYLTDRRELSLRSGLMDVCTSGGKQAFTVASKNIDHLQMISRRICDDRIPDFFKRLQTCLQGPDELEDVWQALKRMNDDVKQGLRSATETRSAFTKWEKMVGELYTATGHQQGQTSTEQSQTQAAENVAKIDQQFATEAAQTAKRHAQAVVEQLNKVEKRLGTATEKVPGPWETVIQGAAIGFAQALPNIVAGIVPMVLAAANPMSAATRTSQGAAIRSEKAAAISQSAGDPAYAVAKEIIALVTAFYEFLGGEKGSIDWEKFGGPEGQSDKLSGISYLAATLNGQKSKVDATGTEANNKLMSAYSSLIKVTDDIKEYMKTQTNLSAASIPDDKIGTWKKTVNQAKLDFLSLSASAPSLGSSNTPTPFIDLKMEIPSKDLSAQNAQLSSALQDVMMTQNVVDVAQASFDAAIKKQAETAAAMAAVGNRLKALQDKGRILDEIKTVLKICDVVIVDLTIQFGKVEQYFTILTDIFDLVLLPKYESFSKEFDKIERGNRPNNSIGADAIFMQTNYTYALQLKGYFSLLADISGMYTEVDRQSFYEGLKICENVSSCVYSGQPIDRVSQDVSRYAQESTQRTASLVNSKQQKLLQDLKDCAKRAEETTKLAEDAVRKRGLTVDEGAKTAIMEGGAAGKEAAKALVDANKSATVLNQEALGLLKE